MELNPNHAEAAGQIWSCFFTQLQSVICKKVNHDECCEDILQDTYFKIAKNIDRIQQADNRNAYLNRLAANAVIDHYRSIKNFTGIAEIPEPVTESNGTDNLTSVLAHSFMMETLQTLPAEYRYALMKTAIDGVSQKELAEELGISYSGIKSRVQRARALLRDRIVACCDYKFDAYGNIVSCCGSACC